MPACTRVRCARMATAVCAAALMATFAFGAVTPDSLPKPTGYVSDLAHVVDPTDKDQLETFCTAVEQQLGVQFALVTIDTLEGQPIRDFALDVFRKWGVGSKQTNQGVLLLLAVKDRQSDIETGRGIEPYITDGFSGATLRDMRPDLRAGNYGQALLTAARTMADQIAQGKGVTFNAPGGATTVPEPPRVVRRSRGGPSGLAIILIIFFILWLLGRMGRGGRGGYRGGGGGSGCLWGLLLGNLLSGGRGGGGGWGGGGWGGGGFGGGGDGGGGGFGGFGGGDAGGGGASSNW